MYRLYLGTSHQPVNILLGGFRKTPYTIEPLLPVEIGQILLQGFFATELFRKVDAFDHWVIFVFLQLSLKGCINVVQSAQQFAKPVPIQSSCPEPFYKV